MDPLPIVLRAHTERTAEHTRKGSRRKPSPRWGDLVLVLDTETTVDSAQALTCGCTRLCRWNPDASLRCLTEFLIHADDLEKRDSEGFAVLKDYAHVHKAENHLRLCSRRVFLDRVLKWAFKCNTLIVGFNLPFDLVRLSVKWAEGRGRYANGFSLVLWDRLDPTTGKPIENAFRWRIKLKPLDSKRSLMEIGRSRKDVAKAKLLDLRTLSYALTDKGYSLASACEAFGTAHRKLETKAHGKIDAGYIDYNRRDVLATQELLEKLREEFDRHPINLDPSNALSTASLARAYQLAMGLVPPMKHFDDFPIEVTAAAMMAYYGGRAECRIRKVVVPVVYCDFLSMYPTVNTLTGLWRILTAETLSAVEATDEVQAFLDGVTLEQCFDPATWKKLNFIATVEPNGDILPVRAPYSDGSRSYNIGLNPLTFDRAIPFAGPDLVASKLLSGNSPKVAKAWRLVPQGVQSGLRPVKVRNMVEIDPVSDDFFRALIEQRKALPRLKDVEPEDRKRIDRFLKILANAGAYGIYAQLNRLDLAEKELVTVHGLDGPFSASTTAVETPGEFYFPPLAALITSGAHLMLTLLEKSVVARKGSYAFCDTDSMAIGLPLREVRRIVKRFEALNPYDRSAIPGSILKIEDENYDPKTGRPRQLFCYAIAAKRYALFNVDSDGAIAIRKYSEHGLGHLMNPIDPEEEESRDWIRQLWEIIVKEAQGEEAVRPKWLNRPAISRITATTPDIVLRLQNEKRRQSYADRIKPMNFLLAAHGMPLDLPEGVSATHFQLIAPYDPDPRHWESMSWTDYYSGKRFAISTVIESGSGVARVKALADVFEEYRHHPEPKSVGSDGEPCGRATSGVLGRRPVLGLFPIYIGKESNSYEEVEQGTIHDWDEVRSQYYDPREDPWRTIVVPVLKMMKCTDVANFSRVSKRHVSRLRNLREMPSPEVRGRLTRIAGDYARRCLGHEAPVDDIDACASFLRWFRDGDGV